MRIVVQRVKEASVSVDKKIVGKIGHGMMVLVGFTEGDTKENIEYLANKLLNLRIFDDENGVMNINIQDSKGSILSVSQFTLYGDASKGNRPSYCKALSGDKAVALYNYFNEYLTKKIVVETGIFGAEMEVSLINDGPVTILLER